MLLLYGVGMKSLEIKGQELLKKYKTVLGERNKLVSFMYIAQNWTGIYMYYFTCFHRIVLSAFSYRSHGVYMLYLCGAYTDSYILNNIMCVWCVYCTSEIYVWFVCCVCCILNIL